MVEMNNFKDNGAKKNLYIGIVCVLLTVMGASAVWANNGSGSPGSEGDPIVSKSYVDARASYKPVSLTTGQKFIGGEGCEVILRSGEANIIAGGENGVADLTQGVDLKGGAPITLNHMLLIPRHDGRGLVATTDIWVMVRGSYTIQN